MYIHTSSRQQEHVCRPLRLLRMKRHHPKMDNGPAQLALRLPARRDGGQGDFLALAGGSTGGAGVAVASVVRAESVSLGTRSEAWYAASGFAIQLYHPKDTRPGPVLSRVHCPFTKFFDEAAHPVSIQAYLRLPTDRHTCAGSRANSQHSVVKDQDHRRQGV
jgi:hypothetical protein